MGNCAKFEGSKNKYSAVELDRFDIEPEDTAHLAGQALPTLKFHALLRKVKIKECTQRRLSVKFIIESIEQLELAEKAVDSSFKVRWIIDETFTFSLTEYELRKKFLVVQVFQEQKLISTLKINLYLISVGPYHLDFALPIEGVKDNKSRISFDLKIAQQVDTLLEPKQIEMIEIQDKQFVEDVFAFSLKTIIGNNPILSSISSTKKNEPGEIDKNHTNKVIWEKNEQTFLPCIEGNFPLYDFHYATLKILFWRITPNALENSEKLIAECYISFVKLLGFDSLGVEKNSKSYQMKKVVLEEKLWLNGEEKGKVKIKMNFQIEKNIKQMLVCVRTEEGVCKSSPVFYSNEKRSKPNCPQILGLDTLISKINQQEGELLKKNMKKQHRVTFTQINQHVKKIQGYLIQQEALLKKTSKETLSIYSYVNEDELIKGQETLISIGQMILKFINDEIAVTDQLKWRMLSLIAKRGEFTLNHIGFDTSNQFQVRAEGYIKKKKMVGLSFQHFIYQTLRLTLHILGVKGLNQQRLFAEEFCAIAYIRIPQFRKIFLNLIERPDDPEIKEWRGTDFSLKNQSTDFKTYLPGENTFQILFDWRKYFYSHLEGEPAYEKNIANLNLILNNEEWQKRLIKRRGAFFSFIREWVNFVSKISVRIVHSNWKYFPGYIQILKAFLSEMKLRPVSEYPSSIKIACNSLLSNENLLNIFITILFNKTNLNNSLDVLKILQLCSNFFKSLQNLNKRIPSTFNYSFFFSGIKMILDSDYSFTAGRALHLLYENFESFNEEFKVDVSNYVLGKNFFTYFLHWSKNVRIIFHHLMVVRINIFVVNVLRDSDTPQLLREMVRKISNRYTSLLVALQNLKKIKAKQYVPTTEDELYKKLRNNIRKKRKQKRDDEKKKDQKGDNNLDDSQVFIKIKLPNSIEELQEQPNLKEENKRMMEELCRPQVQRYDSQMLSQQIQIAFQQNPLKIKDQVIRRKSSSNNVTVNSNSIADFMLGYNPAEGTKRRQKRGSFSLNSNEDVQMPLITKEEVKYVKPAMEEFQATSSIYEKNLKQMKGAPILKMEIMLDSSESRPENFTEAEEW